MKIVLSLILLVGFGVFSGMQSVVILQADGQPLQPESRLSAAYRSDVMGKDVEVQEHAVDRFARVAERAGLGIPLIARDRISSIVTDRAMNITRSGRGSRLARSPSIVIRTTNYSIQEGTTTTAFLRFETTDADFHAYLTGRRKEGSNSPVLRRRATVAIHAYVKNEKVYTDICSWRDFKAGINRSSRATVFPVGAFAAYGSGSRPLNVAFPIRSIGDSGLEAMMRSDRLELIFYDPDDLDFKVEVNFQNYHEAMNTAIAWAHADYSDSAFAIEKDFTLEPVVRPRP